MFRGGGQTVFFEDRDTAAGLSKILWLQPSILTIAGESETAEAQGVPFEPGVVQDLASATISTTITGTLSVQKVGMKEMEAILNTQAAANAGIDLPHPFQKTIASNAVTVTGLTADQKVVVNVTTEGKQQYLTQVTDTPDAAGEYQVTNNTITFNTGDFADGVQVTGVYFANVATGNIIGGNSPGTSYGNIQFFGKLLNTQYTNPVQMYVQQLSIDTSFDLGLIGSAGDDVEIPVTLTTPSGWNRPYAFVFPTS